MERDMSHSRIPPFSVVLIMFALSVAGLASFPYLSVQYTPSDTGRIITVSFSYPDASPELTEAEVTSKIEGVISSIQGVSKVSSFSSRGFGRVSVEFRKGTDMDAARFEVSSAIRNIYSSLPKGMDFPVIRHSSGPGDRNEGVAISYTIKGDMPSREIERYVREHLLTPISALRDVDAVSFNGATPYHWVITFDSGKALSLGLDASDIASAFSAAYMDEVVGTVQTEEGEMAVHLAGSAPKDFGTIPVKNATGHVIRLEDIATWRFEEAPPSSYYRVNGLNTINLSVSVTESSNLLSAVKTIREEMSRIITCLPEGITAEILYDSSEYIREELNRIYFRTGLCILLLLVFIFIVSRSWRYMMIIISTLVVNIFTAIIFYVLAGVQIHIYTLAGITVSLGIVIDTSIIMAEHYGYWRDRTVFPALFAATVTTVGALLMVLLLPEGERTNLSDFIRVIVINLAISLVVAYYFIPSLMEFVPIPVKTGIAKRIQKRHVIRFNNLYFRYIGWGIRNRWLLVLLFLAGFLYPAYLFYHAMNRVDFYRTPVRPQLYIRAGMQEGNSIAQLNDVVKSMENYLAGFDGIEMFRTSISSYDNASIVVDFKPEYEHSAFPEALKSDVTTMAAILGGANWAISGINENDFNNYFASARKSDRIILTGYNYQELMQYSNLLIDRLKANDRVISPEIRSSYNTVPGMEFNLTYNKEAMAAGGVSPDSYYRALSSRLFDHHAGSVLTDGEYTEVVLRSSDSEAFDLWHVLNTPLEIETNKMALSTVGTIQKKRTGIDIRREDQSYVVDICFDVVGSRQLSQRIRTENVEYMNREILPVGYLAKDSGGGLFTSHRDTYEWLVFMIMLIIFVILSMAFESLRLPFAIVFLIPVSFIGVFAVFGFSEISFDQGGFAAFVMLCGIVVNAGIYIMADYRRLVGKNICGIHQRIRHYIKSFNHKTTPILLTAASTVLGLLPFLSDGPGEVFWFDFAIGTISGMAMSLIAIVLYLPVFAIKAKQS